MVCAYHVSTCVCDYVHTTLCFTLIGLDSLRMVTSWPDCLDPSPPTFPARGQMSGRDWNTVKETDLWSKDICSSAAMTTPWLVSVTDIEEDTGANISAVWCGVH